MNDSTVDFTPEFQPSIHVPVLFNEVLDGLDLQAGNSVVDGTLGGAGHTRAIAEKIGASGRLFAFDADPVPIERARSLNLPESVKLIHSNYVEMKSQLAELGVHQIDRVLLDLGLSSDQLADRERGFSYATDGVLDMRFDTTQGDTAADLLNEFDEADIADVIYEFGEERFSRRIAKAIVERRKYQKTWTARDLADLVRRCVPRSKNHSIDPATRTFQALRIAVNRELRVLRETLEFLPSIVKPGGRVAIISFHSLEDRIVKHSFRDSPAWEPVNKKPIEASEQELLANPRSRSAKLRIALRV